jgi:hypothetical protein
MDYKEIPYEVDNRVEWAMLICRSTEDAKEGPRAWREKRPPVFRGR